MNIRYRYACACKAAALAILLAVAGYNLQSSELETPTPRELPSNRTGIASCANINLGARKGIELTTDLVNARRGCFVGHAKKQSTTEKITSSLWSLDNPNSLLRPKNRSPFAVRYSLERINDDSEQNSLSPANDSVVDGDWKTSRPLPQGEACNSEARQVVSDAGSIPAASTPLSVPGSAIQMTQTPSLPQAQRILVCLDEHTLEPISYSDSLFVKPSSGCLFWANYFTSIERAQHLVVP